MTQSELKSARETLGLSQAQLARLLDLHGAEPDRTIRRWETGHSPVPGSVGLLIEALLRYPQLRRDLGLTS